MRILVLFAQQHWTGPAEPELQKLRILRNRGHEITFCFTRKPEGTLKKVVEDFGFPSIEQVMLYRKRPALRRYFKDLRVLTRYCNAWRPDVLHCHLSHDHWTGIGVYSFLRNRPVLIRSIHESRKLKSSWGDRILHRDTNGFFVPSKRFAHAFADSFHVDHEAIEVVNGVVDVQRFQPELETSDIFREIDAPHDSPLIGIVSRIKEERGHDLLIQAFRKVSVDHPAARLLIVGRGELTEALKEAHQDLIRDGRLHFMGYRKEDLPNILNALMVKVLLAEGSDGTCRAVLEAKACGTPVIAAEVGVMPELVMDGKTGLLVRQNDVEYLEVALRSALEHPERMKEMGQEARRVTLENNTIEQAANRVEGFYQKIIKRCRHER
jgi:glycosyltransferase involved in cell wall biosynthesis